MSHFRRALLVFLSLGSLLLCAQTLPPEALLNHWPAQWISVPGSDPSGYGIYLFRKTVELEAPSPSFPVYVTADNRYKLYVNGELVSLGPARGDLNHWSFEVIDIAPYLRKGKNVVAARVWNEGPWRPEAQISHQSGFLLLGATSEAAVLDTGPTWKCMQDNSYHPIEINTGNRGAVQIYGYYVAGPGEEVDMHKYLSGWEHADFDDSQWPGPQCLGRGTPKNTVGLDAGRTWWLVPSPLPQMERTPQRFAALRQVESAQVEKGFPSRKGRVVVPAHSTARLLLDQGELTNAYFHLEFSGGKNSRIQAKYAEALYEKRRIKGHRDSIVGKKMAGRVDRIISSGEEGQVFTTLSYRTFRYVELSIETKRTPLILEDVSSTFTGYPFERRSNLEGGPKEWKSILDIGWRTARLCAMETYMDCPYYEQLQYIGDTRIQMLVTLYNTRDEDLVKQGIRLMDWSRQVEGVTLSRYPTRTPQIIPTFSLWYIGVLHDYMMYGSDSLFLQERLPGSRMVLEYFKKFQDQTGSLRHLPHWFFTDWVDTWKRGMPPLGEDGSSAPLDLQLLIALQYAANLERHMGMPAYAQKYQEEATRLSETIRRKYWDATRGLFADTPEKDHYSQHSNALAILAGLVTQSDMEKMGRILLTDSSLTQASIYFKYYLHRALVRAGLGNDYADWLDKWRENIDLGLSTWAEKSDVAGSRSDCHAWGSSPNIEFFRTVLGIDSQAPQFNQVRIEPHLGKIDEIQGKIPHPKGSISVYYRIAEKGLEARIDLPPSISGVFVWKGTIHCLHGKNNTVRIPDKGAGKK